MSALNNPKKNNRSFRNRENLQYKKTEDSVLLSLLMRTNGNPVVFCLPSEPNIPEGPEYKKYQHYVDAQGEVLPTPHRNNDRNDKLHLLHIIFKWI